MADLGFVHQHTHNKNFIQCAVCGNNLCDSFIGVSAHIKIHAKKRHINPNDIHKFVAQTRGREYIEMRSKR